MWSSSDLQGGYPTQWALNPSAYQNVSNEEVDWASLAQQWIKMKETFPAEQVPPAPPPPPLGGIGANMNVPSGVGVNVKASTTLADVSPDLEGGEAPMDMDTKEENDSITTMTPSSTTGSAPNTQDPPGWGSWNNWQQWGWGNSWSATTAAGTTDSGQGSGGSTVVTDGKSSTAATPSFPFPANATTAHPYNAENSSTYDFNHSGSVDQFNQHGYWMGGNTPYIRPKNADWRHDRNLAGRVGRAPEEKSDEDEEAVPVIDAAKRKQLPAWIREGLEKMEKEKMKKQEKERMIKERELEMARQKEMDELHQNSNPDMVNVPHSKFDSDSEESDDEGQDRSERDFEYQSNRKSRFDQIPNRNNLSSSPPPQVTPHMPSHQPIVNAQPPPPPPVPMYRSKEQIMQEVMKKVRVVLTDLLMCVTSEELDKAANEMLTSMRAKAPAKQHRKTPALTSLTGKLGLSMYNSDDSERSDASDNDDDDYSDRRDSAIDSDEELKERYHRRKQEFARIENDILTNIEEQEERERRLMIDEEAEVDDGEEDVRDNENNDYDESEVGYEHRRGEDDVRQGDDHQVEAKHSLTGNKGVERRIDTVDNSSNSSIKYDEQAHNRNDHHKKRDNDSSGDESEESGDDDDDDDSDSSDSSDSSSDSDSSSSKLSRKRKKYSSKRRKEKKSRSRNGDKMNRKRSRSRSRSSRASSRKNSGHGKSSRDSYSKDDRRRKDSDRRDKDRERHREGGSYKENERSKTRDRSRSRDRDRDRRYSDNSYRYRRHSPSPQRKKHYTSSSSSHRRRRSSSSSDSARSSRRTERERYRSRD